MSADQTKLTIYNPKVEPNPRDLITDARRELKEEEEATELAMRLALEDPSEVDNLENSVARARARLRVALGELARSMIALFFAYLARLFMSRARNKVTRERGVMGRAECGVLALQRLLESFYVRRLLGRRNLLRMLGATVRYDDEGNPVASVKLAKRRYRAEEGFCGQGHASAADSPTTRVVIGLRLAAGEPAWCLRRFVSNDSGSWRLVHSSREPDAESLLLAFYAEPDVHEQPVTGEPALREAAQEPPRDAAADEAAGEQRFSAAA